MSSIPCKNVQHISHFGELLFLNWRKYSHKLAYLYVLIKENICMVYLIVKIILL